VAIVLKRVSKLIKGIGIVSPSLVPPLLTAFLAILVGGDPRHIIAHVSGTLGVLIGADLLNFKRVFTIRFTYHKYRGSKNL
jgi:uncharacterized membrane protein